MAVGVVDIANMALRKVGDYSLMSMDDPSDHAALLRAVYPFVRDAETAACRWGFALHRAVLPALEEAPAFGFARAFQLPADCLRLVQAGRVFPQTGLRDYALSPDAAWSVEGGRVLTDLPAPLHIRYLRRVEDPMRYPPVFVMALACKLAIEIHPRLAGGASAKETLWREYGETIKQARRANAIERAPETPKDGAWMTSRMSGEREGL